MLSGTRHSASTDRGVRQATYRLRHASYSLHFGPETHHSAVSRRGVRQATYRLRHAIYSLHFGPGTRHSASTDRGPERPPNPSKEPPQAQLRRRRQERTQRVHSPRVGDAAMTEHSASTDRGPERPPNPSSRWPERPPRPHTARPQPEGRRRRHARTEQGGILAGVT